MKKIISLIIYELGNHKLVCDNEERLSYLLNMGISGFPWELNKKLEGFEDE